MGVFGLPASLLSLPLSYLLPHIHLDLQTPGSSIPSGPPNIQSHLPTPYQAPTPAEPRLQNYDSIKKQRRYLNFPLDKALFEGKEEEGI